MSEDKNRTTPVTLACQLSTMTSAERERYSSLKQQLRGATQEVTELPEGYAFRYPGDSVLVQAVAEFITLERHCCPFYSFILELGSENGPLWLRIVGPAEAKSFIYDAIAPSLPENGEAA